MKNGLAKNKIRGPFRPRGEGGQDEMVPGPFQNTFFIFEPFPKPEHGHCSKTR